MLENMSDSKINLLPLFPSSVVPAGGGGEGGVGDAAAFATAEAL
jgi:hypothetical protein